MKRRGDLWEVWLCGRHGFWGRQPHYRITPCLVHRLERKVTKFDFMEEVTREWPRIVLPMRNCLHISRCQNLDNMLLEWQSASPQEPAPHVVTPHNGINRAKAFSVVKNSTAIKFVADITPSSTRKYEKLTLPCRHLLSSIAKFQPPQIPALNSNVVP